MLQPILSLEIRLVEALTERMNEISGRLGTKLDQFGFLIV
jgi:hypothetical protein